MRRWTAVLRVLACALLLVGCGIETVTDEEFAARPDLYGGYFSFSEAGIAEVRDLVGGDAVPVRFLSLLDNSEAQVQAVPGDDPGELDLWVIDDGRVTTQRPIVDPNTGSTFLLTDERIGLLARIADRAIDDAGFDDAVRESMIVGADGISAEVRSERRTATLRYDGGGRLTGRD